MRASARPSAGQTALLLSKIEDEEETGRAIARKSEKSVALPDESSRHGELHKKFGAGSQSWNRFCW
jgi:hypothetical protein